jgi:hypothetical protein
MMGLHAVGYERRALDELGELGRKTELSREQKEPLGTFDPYIAIDTAAYGVQEAARHESEFEEVLSKRGIMSGLELELVLKSFSHLGKAFIVVYSIVVLFIEKNLVDNVVNDVLKVKERHQVLKAV